MVDINSFFFANANSRDYEIIITTPPVEVFAEREVENISIPGRSGNLLIDLKRYKNVPIQYQCVLLPEEHFALRKAAIDAQHLLFPSSEYRRLEDTYHPDYYRMARVTGLLSIESIVEQAGKFTVSFDCKPQRFLKTGEIPVTMDTAGVLRNPTLFPALPLIIVYGAGAGALKVGDIFMEIKSMEDHVYLDSDTQNAYRVGDGGALENKNGTIKAPEFPVLAAGENTISWTGGITKIEIIPRWWTL